MKPAFSRYYFSTLSITQHKTLASKAVKKPEKEKVLCLMIHNFRFYNNRIADKENLSNSFLIKSKTERQFTEYGQLQTLKSLNSNQQNYLQS